MQRILFQMLLALVLTFSLSACGSDSDSSDGAGGAGGSGGAGGAGGAGPAVPDSPMCPADGDKCPAACTYLAACAVNSGLCVGYEAGNDEQQTAIYESCLETCAGLPVQATLVCGHSECSQTVNLANGASEDFKNGCEGNSDAGGAGGEGGAGGAGGAGGDTWGQTCTEDADCAAPTDLCVMQPGAAEGYCSVSCGTNADCTYEDWTCNAVGGCGDNALAVWCGPPSEIEEGGGVLVECQ